MKNSLYLMFLVVVFAVAGCATSSDLKMVRSELNQQVEEKVVAVNTRIATLQKEQEKNTETLASLRKGQANASADFTELRDQVQQLRGEVETLKKETSRDKDDREKIDSLL